jgi:hypothetical protein
MKKIFVMIRDKLGDTLIAFQALATYRAAHPDDVITLMVHAHYLPIFAKEPGYHLLPYRSSAQAFVWALWQRLACRRFDALVVLRGFGEKIVRLTKLLPATQRIHALSRFPEAFRDSPPLPSPACLSEQALIASAWRGLRVLDPALPCPDRLSLPGLIAHYRRTPEIVVICPVSDEASQEPLGRGCGDDAAPDSLASSRPEYQGTGPSQWRGRFCGGAAWCCGSSGFWFD